jgi:hypothetical protein
MSEPESKALTGSAETRPKAETSGSRPDPSQPVAFFANVSPISTQSIELVERGLVPAL